MKYFLTILITLFPLYASLGQGENDVYAEAVITSKHLTPGESTHLIIRLRRGQADSKPAVPVVEGSAINFVRTATQIDQQRNLIQAYLYRVTPSKAGNFTIPPVTLTSGGKPYKTPALDFSVHAIDELIPLATGIDKQNVLAGFFTEKKTLYQGEQSPITLKLYAPQQLRIASWGTPDPIKENCLAWRFSVPSLNELGQVHINGVPHLSAIYSTTLSGISPGIATFGPSKLSLIIRQRRIDPRLGSRISDTTVAITLPALDFDILPFPHGAPADFQGAVGQFQIEAQCEKLTIAKNDTTEVTLRVEGIGNLENIKAPVLSQNTWKIIDTAKVTRGTERRYIRGLVTFRQIIRSRGIQPSIPAYSFSYFDPRDKSFHTLTTPPIPVSVTPALGSLVDNTNHTNGNLTSEKLGTRPEEMRDILGFINKPSLQYSKFSILDSKFIHIAPAILCLLIIALSLWRKFKASSVVSPYAECQSDALKKLSTATDTRTFYRRAGRFIDQWLSPNDKLDTILAERDAICFQPEETELEVIAPSRKNEIIKLLKSCSKLTLTLLFLLTTTPIYGQESSDQEPQNLSLARDAWKIGQYQQAIDFYQKAYPDPSKAPADILFNIGNCRYRLTQFGHAALAWRRTLVVNPAHQKARQNLRYLETEKGSITSELHSWQHYITVLHTQVYRLMFLTALWVFLITLLILVFLKPLKPKRKTALITLVFLIPLPLTIGALGLYYYPDSDSHTPYREQAVCLNNTPLYKEAHREDKNSLSLPEASHLHILAIRGPWTHIETPDGQSGWVQSKEIGIITP